MLFRYTSRPTSLASPSTPRSSLSFANNRVSANAPDAVTVNTEQFAIAGTSDLKQVPGTGMTGSYTQAMGMVGQLVAAQPSLQGQIQIVHDYELNPN